MVADTSGGNGRISGCGAMARALSMIDAVAAQAACSQSGVACEFLTSTSLVSSV